MVVNGNGQCQRCGKLYGPPCAVATVWPNGVCQDASASVRDGVCKLCGLDYEFACPVSTGYPACRSPAMARDAKNECYPGPGY